MSFKIQDKFIHDLLNAVDPATREFMVGDPQKALLTRPASVLGL